MLKDIDPEYIVTSVVHLTLLSTWTSSNPLAYELQTLQVDWLSQTEGSLTMKDLAGSGATISHVTGQHASFPASNILKE